MEPVSIPVEPAKKRRIGVLTSGGDAPGMNGAVRAVVRMAIHCDCEAYAIFEGYEGLVNGGNMIRQLHWEDVRGWQSRGGTLIGSARCMSFRERAGRLRAAKNMVLRGIDALVVCGGDGSLTGADVFRAEWPGLLAELVSSGELSQEQIEPYQVLNIVGLVGSIDNDMSGTDATIGCYSSLTRICDAVDDVFDTAFSHQRGFVIEVMGRHCGWLALMSAISTGADWLFIPEMPPKDGWEDEMCSVITKVFPLTSFYIGNCPLLKNSAIEPQGAWQASHYRYRRRGCAGSSTQQGLQFDYQGYSHAKIGLGYPNHRPGTHSAWWCCMRLRPLALHIARCRGCSCCSGDVSSVPRACHHYSREQDYAHSPDGCGSGYQGRHSQDPRQGL